MLDYSFLSALLGTVGALYHIFIQPLFFSPLRRIPNAPLFTCLDCLEEE